jgi:uncharacterized membrane protein YdbT with pleckstrin-like domain
LTVVIVILIVLFVIVTWRINDLAMMVRLLGVEISKVITALVGKDVLTVDDLDTIEFKSVKKVYKDRDKTIKRRVKKDLDDKSKQDLSD